jgi:hypothetical protein
VRQIDIRANDWKHTRRGDLPSDLHGNIEEVFDCRLAIIKVVSSSNGCRRIRNLRSELGRQGGIGDVLGRDVVLVTSRDRDVGLSNLQNESYNFVGVGVQNLAPLSRGVEKTEQRACCGVRNRASGRSGSETVPFRAPGAAGTG